MQFVRDMLTRRSPDLAAGLTVYRQVLRGKQPVGDEEQSLVKSHLKLSGVVKCQQDGVLQVRNPIYREVFGLDWVREHLPINWVKRLRRAAVFTGTVFLVGTVPLSVIAAIGWKQAADRGVELAQANEDLAEALEEAHTQRKRAEEGQEKAEVERARAEEAKRKRNRHNKRKPSSDSKLKPHKRQKQNSGKKLKLLGRLKRSNDKSRNRRGLELRESN